MLLDTSQAFQRREIAKSDFFEYRRLIQIVLTFSLLAVGTNLYIYIYIAEVQRKKEKNTNTQESTQKIEQQVEFSLSAQKEKSSNTSFPVLVLQNFSLIYCVRVCSKVRGILVVIP